MLSCKYQYFQVGAPRAGAVLRSFFFLFTADLIQSLDVALHTLTLSVSITNTFMVVYPQAFLSDGWERDEEEGWGGGGEESVDMSCQTFRPIAARVWRSIWARSQSAAEQRWKSSLLISTDWNVSLSPAPSGNRSRILSVLFLNAQEDFLRGGSGQRTRWTRGRIHAGGTNRTPYSSFAAWTRWVSFTVEPVFLFFFFLSWMQRTVQRLGGREEQIVGVCCLDGSGRTVVNPEGRIVTTELSHMSDMLVFWRWPLDVCVSFWPVRTSSKHSAIRWSLFPKHQLEVGQSGLF